MTPLYVLRGYPEKASVSPGDTLTLYVACVESSGGYNSFLCPALARAPYASRFPFTDFRIEFYRQGVTIDLVMGPTDWMPCHLCQPGLPDVSWSEAGWQNTAYSFSIPLDWKSGVYIAMFTGRYWCDTQRKYIIATPDSRLADDRAAKVLFVVRGSYSRRADILYKIPLNTYHAYNYEGGGSLYDDSVLDTDGQPHVTLLRPGGGTGGVTGPSDYGSPDYYDSTSPRQTFAHWDARFISWMEANHYKADYCTDCDIDVDEDGRFLSQYNLLLSAGHDEYWSDGMRHHVNQFIRGGGNVAFFSGNTCWWRVAYGPSRGSFCCEKNLIVKVSQSGTGQRGNWWVYGLPENSLTGVSYRNGGGFWAGPRPPLGYAAQHAENWVFSGTGLNDGDVFGSDSRLIGYECDGTQITFDPKNGLASATRVDQTPANFIVLGYAGPLDSQWQDLPANECSPARSGSHFATMGIYRNGGYVFTASTTDWARLLSTDSHVHTITRNVMDTLGHRSRRHRGNIRLRLPLSRC